MIIKSLLVLLICLEIVTAFNLRFINADYSSARFELVDDNQTTINYVITYDLTSIKQDADPNVIETLTATRIIKMQTNSDKLAQKQLNTSKLNLTTDESVSGENYGSGELRQIDKETWADMHQFVIGDLEENRWYKISFKINAKPVHLKLIPVNHAVNKTGSNGISKEFDFRFKTTFDLEKAAKQACDQFKHNKTKPGESAQCYENDSECKKCKPNCYQLNSAQPKSKPSSLVLCEPCPCDSLKSTGSCIYSPNDDDVMCKQCIKPYTGSKCSQCENDGISFYKNEDGKCMSCECNGNAWADNFDPANYIRNGIKRRKCQAITGNCVECLFNTTGKHCDECKSGFQGDALKRTCVLKPQSSDDSNKIKSQTTTINSNMYSQNHKNNSQSYRSLALFSIYIFCILFLIIVVYLFIKFKYYQDAALKNGPYHPMGCLMSCSSLCQPVINFFHRLSDSSRSLRTRISIHLVSLCPNLMGSKLRGATPLNTNNNRNQNDEDRLNLAEYQMFDESLCANDEAGNSYTFRPKAFDDSDELHFNDKNNPYCSLTIKS